MSEGVPGYPMPQQGPGGYPMPQQGPGGYPMPQQGPGGYPMPQQGPGGYPMPQQGPGGYPMPQQGPGGYPMPQQGTGGYPQAGAGGYPQPGGPGGYAQPGAGGYPQPGGPGSYGQPGAGGYPQPGGPGSYAQPGAGSYPQPGGPGGQPGMGGYPMPNQPQSGLLAGLPGVQGTSSCCTQVELTIKCHNLADKDMFSKSDPMALVYIQVGNQWVEKGRTENVKNNQNPQFATKIKLDFYFEQVQKIRVDIYDIDNRSATMKDDDFLGTMEWTLGQVVASSPFTKPLLRRNGQKMGKSTITIYAIELDSSGKNELLQLVFKGQKLDSKDFMGKSDPFLEIMKAGKDGTWQMIHRTEVIKNNLNPSWKPFEVNRQLVGGINENENLLIRCYDYDGDGTHELIGEAKLILLELLDGQSKTWPLINLKKQQKKGKSYKDSGKLILESCKINKSYSFLDYIFGGTKVNFMVAVDFTASNGDPRDPNSLHFLNPSHPNDYVSAIQTIGAIIQDYDSDKMFPGLGFGAKIPPNYQVSHEFALNFNMSNPFCPGIEGLIAAYQNCLSQIQLYGPTNFAPIINHCSRFANQSHAQVGPDNYFVLLILTDGEITDMGETCDAIVKASNLPMSIIIIGVGNADFSKMNFLDGDGGALKSPSGARAVRDIVQFVPFNRYKMIDRSYLAREVLAEVPQQLTQYFRLRNMPPNPARQNVQEFT